MVLEQVQSYDKNAERVSLQWAAETGPSSYQHRLDGIQRDIISFQNEQTNEYAYWSGTYELGVDGHGKPALVTSEIAIPGRVHRSDSHAMVDSMAGNAVYVLDQIEKGTMSHDAWDTARVQLKQFRAVQEAALLLQDGESLLGFAMNGKTTRDGIALMQITRQQNVFQYETRLLGGLSEGAAHDILKKYTSDSATHISLNEKGENPLYTAIKGKISIHLKNQQEIITTVQEVLDARKETLTTLVSTGTCRSKEVQPELDNKKIKPHDSFVIKKQHEYVMGLMQKKRIEDIPYVYIQPDIHRNQQLQRQEIADRSGVLFDSTSKSKQSAQSIKEVSKEVSKKISETEYLIHNHAIREIINPEFSQCATTVIEVKHVQRQKKEAINQEVHNKKTENVLQQSQIEMPITTFLVKSESQNLPVYIEKALTIALSVDAQLFDEETDTIHEVMSEQIAVYAPHMRREKEMSDEQSDVREVNVAESKQVAVERDVYVAVDQIRVQDMQAFVVRFEKQVKKGTVKGEVKKLVWMEPINQTQTELLPVEEMEIDKDTTKTIHNLLHFLRKVVRIYAGNDVIRERGIKRIISDNPRSELEELEEYIHVLQAARFRGHMFAMVS